MRFIIWFLIVSFTITQAIVTIDSSTSSITDFEVEYFVDSSDKLKVNDIKYMKFTRGKNSDTLGAKDTNSWVKIKLLNNTTDKQTLFLHQDLGYTFLSIDFYEFDKSNTLLNKKEINIFSKNVKKQMAGADAIFKFSLEPNTIKTIYVHQKTHAYHFYNFSIFSADKSLEYLIFEKIDGILFVGILLSFAIYNLFIFFSSRYKEYLYYSLYLFSATIWIFYMYGSLAHYFHIYEALPFRFNYALMFIPIFLSLFIQTIFETKKFYKTEHNFLNSMIIILFINFIYAIINFGHALEILSLILNYTLIVFMWLSISIYKKGNKIIRIFLLAHTFYLILNIYAMLFYTGFVDFTYISSHGIGIGIMIEALMLSYLVSYKFRIMQEEKNKSQLLLLQKTKMADMGEMIGNIAHQWRQPLATIGVSSGILREKKLLNKLSDKDFDEELNHIDSNILHMSQTVEDFLTYFKPNKVKKYFHVLDAVDKSLLIIGNTIYKYEIKILLNIDKKNRIFGLKEEFVQVLISIITNAIHVLKDKQNKTIKITSKKYNSKVNLSIENNGGGIKTELLDKVFEPYFTTKHQTQGTGLGLYISKTIINSMSGNLSVKNTKDGAKFSITI